MERQDLSQGQLQAFKFTPVDDPVIHSRHGRAALQSLTPSHFVKGGCTDSTADSSNPSLNGSFELANINLPSLNDAPLGCGFSPVQSSLDTMSDSPKKKYIQASAQRIMQASVSIVLFTLASI